MKTRLTLLLVLFILTGIFSAPQNTFAQRATAKNNDIAVDFIDFLVNNTFTAQYEFKSTPTTSFLIRGEYVVKSEITTGNGKTTALGFGGAWRFYVLDSRALAGFSIAPALDVFFFKNLIRSNILFSIGADGAYKFFFDQITIEPTIGARFGITPGGQLPEGENSFTQIYPVVSVYLGWAW